MIWHAYILNPRDFLEDCIRLGKMSFWAAGMPWEIVHLSIDNNNFEYDPGTGARSNFEQSTGLQWDNVHDPPYTTIYCTLCNQPVAIPWLEEYPDLGPLEDPFGDCKGYCDKNFRFSCPNCADVITHEKLHVAKFRRDMQSLIEDRIPMPGTILSHHGLPEPAKRDSSFLFPNKLILKCIKADLEGTTNVQKNLSVSVVEIRNTFDRALKNKGLIRPACESIVSRNPRPLERRAVRNMLSRYWDNSSPFSLDLAGAAIRQGTFVSKMDDIDWIHSPALEATMNRLIAKYGVFFNIMAENMTRVAVPTLDVDLAWHTHQLSPPRYFAYSTYVTKLGGVFIDHDDKIEETKLSDGFEWTSKQYQRMTGGKLYSECTCWYCEAVRESHNKGLFVSDSTSTARSQALKLHNSPDASSDPSKSAHISAHNAVRPQDSLTNTRLEIKEKFLMQQYEKSARRMRKINKKPAQNDSHPDRYAYATVWGMPMTMPFYAPYSVDPCINNCMYSCTPACMSVGIGAAGNCVSGTGGADGGGGGGGYGGYGGCGGGSGGGCGGGGGGGGGGCGGGGGGGC